MSSILELPSDVAEKIAAQAAARGLPVDEYLRSLVEEQAAKVEPRSEPSAREKARLWREWAKSHDPDTPLLSDEAISREHIYQERG